MIKLENVECFSEKHSIYQKKSIKVNRLQGRNDKRCIQDLALYKT